MMSPVDKLAIVLIMSGFVVCQFKAIKANYKLVAIIVSALAALLIATESILTL